MTAVRADADASELTPVIELTENGFMHILRCALFRDSFLDPDAEDHDLPPGIQEQLSPEARALLDKWLREA